jgi:hypothetical protein
VSPFAVRLPALLFGLLYLWSAWRLARVLLSSGWLFLATMAVAAAVPLGWNGFVRADGAGAALALMVCAVWLAVEQKHLNPVGICIGLSISAQMSFAIPSVAVGLAILAIQRRWTDWIDRVLIPATVVTSIFLILPLSHAHAAVETTPELTERQAAHLQSALGALRASAGADRIRIGASPSAEPIVNFYRAQYRANTWERAERDLTPEHFDYYLLQGTGAELVDQRHLIVLYRDVDFLLARKSYAAL